MGLKHSEHISMIVVDPRDSNVVWVAAQGPLWSAGGDRGLYVTRDGGKTWKKAFETSREHRRDRGPARPAQPRRDVRGDLPAPPPCVGRDRRRARVAACTSRPTAARPGARSPTACRRSTSDASGWRSRRPTRTRCTRSMDAQDKKGGFFRSTDGGENWDKRSDYLPTRSQYYMELFADPKAIDRVYSMDTFMHGLRRRRQDVPSRRREAQARRQPRAVDRPGQHQASARRLRRRPVPELRPRRDLDLDATTCRSRSSTRSASTTRCRSTTSTAARRTTIRSAGRRARASAQRHRQFRLVRHPVDGDGFQSRGRSDRSEHRLLGVAVRRARALRPRAPASASTSSRKPARTIRRCAGTGTRR